MKKVTCTQTIQLGVYLLFHKFKSGSWHTHAVPFPAAGKDSPQHGFITPFLPSSFMLRSNQKQFTRYLSTPFLSPCLMSSCMIFMLPALTARIIGGSVVRLMLSVTDMLDGRRALSRLTQRQRNLSGASTKGVMGLRPLADRLRECCTFFSWLFDCKWSRECSALRTSHGMTHIHIYMS